MTLLTHHDDDEEGCPGEHNGADERLAARRGAQQLGIVRIVIDVQDRQRGQGPGAAADFAGAPRWTR